MGRLNGGSLRAGRIAARVAGLGVVLGLALSLVPAIVAADWAQFGKPTAESTFVGGVDFRQPVTIDRPLARVELLLSIGDAIGPAVIPIAVPSSTGSTILTYHFDPAVDGHLYPDTRLVARWRLVPADASTAVSVGPAAELIFVDDRFTWRTATGDLVRVHWYEGSASFGQRALKIGEDAVRRVSELLGVTESDPIDFFVYADKAAFYDALGPRVGENVGGAHIPGTRLMFALISPDLIADSEVARIVPHELTHLVFETAAGNPYHAPPLWLNEGLAVYLSQGYDLSDRSLVEDATRSGTIIPLDGLIGQFPPADRFFLAYAESASAVDYLVRIHGRDQLVSLIRSYAQGRTDDEAFKGALGLDVAAFGAAWLGDLGATAGARYGPQSAPPGPVPSAWLVDAGASGLPAASQEAAASPGASPATGAPSPATDATGIVLLIVLVAGIAIAFIVAVLTSRRRRAGPGSVG